MNTWRGVGRSVSFVAGLSACGGAEPSLGAGPRSSASAAPLASASVAPAPVDHTPHFVLQGPTLALGGASLVSHDASMIAIVGDGITLVDTKSGHVRARYPRCADAATFSADDSKLVVIECPTAPSEARGSGIDRRPSNVTVWDLATDTVRELARGRFRSVDVVDDNARLYSDYEAKSIDLATNHVRLAWSSDEQATVVFLTPDLLLVNDKAIDAQGRTVPFAGGDVSPDGKLRAEGAGIAALGQDAIATPFHWDSTCRSGAAVWAPNGKWIAATCVVEIDHEAITRATVFDTQGKEVSTLLREPFKGSVELRWADDSSAVAVQKQLPGNDKYKTVIVSLAERDRGVEIAALEGRPEFSRDLKWAMELDRDGATLTNVRTHGARHIDLQRTLLLPTFDGHGNVVEGANAGSTPPIFDPMLALWSEGFAPTTIWGEELREMPDAMILPVVGQKVLEAAGDASKVKGAGLGLRRTGSEKITPLAQSEGFLRGYPYPRLSPKGAYAVAFSEKAVGFWNAKTGKTIATVTGETTIESCSFDGNEERVLVGAPSKRGGEQVQLVSLQSGKVLWSLDTATRNDGDPSPRTDVWSPSGDRIAVSGAGIVDAKTGKIITPTKLLASAPWGADDSIVLVASEWKESMCTGASAATIEVMRAADGSKVASLDGSASVVRWSPDKAFVATRDACPGQWIRVWDAKTWKVWKEFHAADVAWSSDGRVLYASSTGDLRMIRVSDGVELHETLTPPKVLTYTDDGRFEGSDGALALVMYRMGGDIMNAPLVPLNEAAGASPCRGLLAHFFRGDALTCDPAPTANP